MKDLNNGRNHSVIAPKVNPDRIAQIIKNQGTFARVMRSRYCPCAGSNNGTPDIYCELCRGEGRLYDFQREMFIIDDRAQALLPSGNKVYVFWTPMIRPIKFQLLTGPSQQGIVDLEITDFTPEYVEVDYEVRAEDVLRASYVVDRFTYVEADQLSVIKGTRILIANQVLADDGYNTSNSLKAKGDLTKIVRVYDTANPSITYDVKEFRKDQIILVSPPETIVDKQLSADYYFAPPTTVLHRELESTNEKEKFMSDLPGGIVQFSIDGLYDLAEGDLVTLLIAEYFRDQVIAHSETGYDDLWEFDVSRVNAEIISRSGKVFHYGTDFYLEGFRRLNWIGEQPQPGESFSVRYAYHPTYILFKQNPSPNDLQNKRFPKVFYGYLFSKFNRLDTQQSPNIKNNSDLSFGELANEVKENLERTLLRQYE